MQSPSHDPGSSTLAALDSTRPVESSAERSLDDLIRLHGGAVARVAALFERNVEDRQDLLQQIWLAAWSAWPEFRGECSERTFVLRIAHNRGVSALCRRRAPVLGLEEAVDVPDPAPGPERRSEAEQDVERLLGGLHRLNVVQRQVLGLMFEGVPQSEIADILGMSVTNVAVTLHRARATLRQLMEETK